MTALIDITFNRTAYGIEISVGNEMNRRQHNF